MERFYVFVARLSVNLGNALSRCGIIASQPTVVLFTIKLEDVYHLTVWAPRYVCQVAVGRCRLVVGSQIDSLVFLYVIHPDGNIMTLFANHRVFVGFIGSNTCCYVHLRVVGNVGLVHAVESQ